MRMAIIALVAVLLLGGGGAGAYFFVFNKAEASVGEAHKDVKKAKREKPENTEFVELDPLILPIIDGNGVSQTVSMVVTIEVMDAKGAEKVKKYMPKLMDSYIQDMYGVLNKHAALEGGVIKVKMLKNRINKISQHILGDDVVYDVLLQAVQQRRV